VSHEGVEIGHEIPRLEIVLSGDDVRRYATTAQMPGQRFFSDEFARKDGLPGQILPGNMSMALLSRMLHDWLPQAKIERLGVTFRGVVFPGKPIVCSGYVTDRRDHDGAVELECDLILEQGGERRTTGLAVLRLEVPAAAPG
jgi:acyl dehydratase